MKIHISYESNEWAAIRRILNLIQNVLPLIKVKRKKPQTGEKRRHIYIQTQEDK